MVVHPAAGHDSGTLVNALLHHITDLSGVGGELRPGIVHRLDRGTSGVMVVAKNDAAHQELSRQFHDREVEKEYIALVWGVVQAGRRIDAAIGRDPVNRQKMSARAKHARNAVTRITRAHHMPGVTLCQVAIHTGRTHQIRVHLSAIGHPIVGDSVYGGVHRRVAGDIKAVQRLTRPFLHAARLVFHHPRDGRRMEFITPLPDDLMSVLEDLPGWPPRNVTRILMIGIASPSCRARSGRCSRDGSSRSQIETITLPKGHELKAEVDSSSRFGRDHPGDRRRRGHPRAAVPRAARALGVGAAGRKPEAGRGRREGGAPGVPRGNRPDPRRARAARRVLSDARLLR